MHLVSLALVLLLGIVSGVARASDGRIEINQACAVNTGCLTGDSAGFPVTLSGQRSYVLTSSLTVGAEGVSALLVSGSEVDIDLNGFMIRGAYTCNLTPPDCVPQASANGIDGPGSWNTSIRNGKLQRFTGAGVSLGVRARIQDVLVEFMGGDGVLAQSGSLVLDNQIENVRLDGIRIYFDGSTLGVARVEGNVVRSARGDGLEMATGVVRRNYFANIVGADAKLATGALYGQNRFDVAPTGGRSTGDNVCGTSLC